MPRCCSVMGCKSNYRSERGFVTTFALPREECLKAKWLRKIPTDFSGLKNPIVCINHFSEEDIIRTDKCVVKGELTEFERKIPKLKEGAVPCIFPNVPSYLSETKNVTKRLTDVEEEQMRQAISESLKTNKEFLLSKKISGVNDIIRYYNEKLASKGWTLPSDCGIIYLLLLNYSWLQCNKTVDVELPNEFMLIEALDRGKLMFPSEIALKCMCVVWYVVQIIVDDFKKEFLACVNQLGILKKFTSEMLLDYLRDWYFVNCRY